MAQPSQDKEMNIVPRKRTRGRMIRCRGFLPHIESEIQTSSHQLLVIICLCQLICMTQSGIAYYFLVSCQSLE